MANTDRATWWENRGAEDARNGKSPLVSRTRSGYRFDQDPPSHWSEEDERLMAGSYCKGYEAAL